MKIDILQIVRIYYYLANIWRWLRASTRPGSSRQWRDVPGRARGSGHDILKILEYGSNLRKTSISFALFGFWWTWVSYPI